MSAELTLPQQCYNIITGMEEVFHSVLVDKEIVFEREARFAMQILTGGTSDYLMKTALSNAQSLKDCITNVAAIGISLNPARKLAYLVPRKGRICLDISYMGLLEIAISSGSILWGQAKVAKAKDTFEITGFDRPPEHRYNAFSKDRGETVGVYVVVKTRDGDYLTETMEIDEVNAIRDRSEAWKSYVADNKKLCPWVTDPGEMQKKTVIKRAYKTWPKSDRLAEAINHLNTEGEEGINFVSERGGQNGSADPSRLADLLAQVEKATTPDAVTALWTANVKAAQEEAHNTKDRSTYDAFKAAVQARGKALKDANVTDVEPKTPKPASDVDKLDDLLRRIKSAPDAAALTALEPEIDAMPAHLAKLNEAYNAAAAAMTKD